MRLRQDKDNDMARRTRRRLFRPVSTVVLAAIVVVLFLGLNYIFVKDNPERFAGFLMLNFLFFFLATVLAIDDIVRIITASVTRRHEIYRRTVGDEQFRSRLRDEVRRHLPTETGSEK